MASSNNEEQLFTVTESDQLSNTEEDEVIQFLKQNAISQEETNMMVIEACEKNWLNVIDTLINNLEVNVNFIHNYSKTPLMIAAERGHNRIMEKLLKAGADVNIEILMRKTALHIACENQHLESVKMLIEYNSDINAVAIFGTPIVYAIRKDNHQIVEYFLEIGYDINSKDIQGNTLLHNCAECNSYNTVKFLLARGAAIDAVNNNNQTPLAYVCIKDSEQIAEALLKKGADVNSKCILLNTPLHYACQYNRIDIVKLLLLHGADITCRNQQNQTAADVAGNNEAIVTLLRNHSSKMN